LIAFLFPVSATSISIHVPFSLSRIMMSGLLLGMVLSVALVHLIHYYYYYHYSIGFILLFAWVSVCFQFRGGVLVEAKCDSLQGFPAVPGSIHVPLFSPRCVCARARVCVRACGRFFDRLVECGA
jgi:hypothetical protein